MYVVALRRLLEMYPAGASSEQILYHLRTGGIRATAVDILQGLNTLSGSGEATIVADGRWKLAKFLGANTPTGGKQGTSNPGSPEAESGALLAVAGRHISKPPPELDLSEERISDDGAWRLGAYWHQLLSYYAATQRADPRGKVTQFADRHGEGWQLLAVRGCWWKNAELRFATESLPEKFREALAKRKERICALGYPISVFNTKDVVEFVPALLVTASWRIANDDLQIEVGDSDPVINPDWLKRVCGATSWTEDDLTETLLPLGEDCDLDAIASRMRNALAKLGGGGLSPANPADQLPLGLDGLRNCAATFLPTDARFSQGTAADLDAIAAWPEEEFRRSALYPLFSETDGNEARPWVGDVQASIPLMPIREMTDRQFDAAQAATTGPLTVIQGPPGTGKSDVVVSLLLSIFMSRQSVLFASKNHQALDEVEARLSKLVGTNPVLTRGRDAEGDRDTNFLAALKELSTGEPRPGTLPPPIDDLVAAAEIEASDRALRQTRAELEIELTTLIERSLFFEPAGRSTSVEELSFWRKVLNAFAKWFRRPTISPDTPVPEGAGVDEVRRRIELLRAKIAALPSPQSAALYAASPERTMVQSSIVEKFAEFITRIDSVGRQSLIDRLKEMEFNGVTKSKRLLAEDARLLLSHRPIWAISKLSVPTRVPLVAGLFDFLVIDESSQCDIASALPLLARAKRVVVVGDPMQLSFIPQLSRQQEHALMDAAGIPKGRRHAIAQSVNSMFDLAEKRPVSRSMFLADQFRSAPGIVDYINDEYYGGRLVARRDEGDLRLPRDYKPGLEWRDVKGRPGWEDGGNINAIEADAIVALIVDLVRNRMFSGSIGVLSPFTTQVARLSGLTRQILTDEERARVALKVATIDKFQGGEADVVLFSPVIASGAGFGIVNFLRRERRRLNVAISRARALCLVVGDLSYALESDIPHIRNLARRATSPFSPPREGFDSEWERRLDAAMRRRGLNPIPQHPVGSKYLDFALFEQEVKLDVEVDGRAFHTDFDGNRKISDLLRDKELMARGWKVRRFWVSELHYDMESCLDPCLSG